MPHNLAVHFINERADNYHRLPLRIHYSEHCRQRLKRVPLGQGGVMQFKAQPCGAMNQAGNIALSPTSLIMLVAASLLLIRVTPVTFSHVLKSAY